MRTIASIISAFITLPIWYYLLYKILVAVGATDLMWFLYVAYIPFGLISHICISIATKD